MAQLDRIAQAAFKKLFGLGHTEVKGFPIGNESDSSAITTIGRDIYTDTIGGSAGAVAGIIVDCTNATDGTATSRLTLTVNPADTAGEGVAYYATVPASHGLLSEINPNTGALFQVGDRVSTIVPKKFGSTWRPIVYAAGPTEIPPLDISDWFLDEKAGIAYFGTAPSSTPVRLGCYVYVGRTVSNLVTSAITVLTGDVTATGPGSVAATIANNAVTLAKMADMATASFLGRNTAATGDPEVLSIATAKTMLNLTGTNSGDQTITLTGDVTGSGTGSFAATIANDAVTLAKMANMATLSVIGRSTAGTGDPEIIDAGSDFQVLRRSGTTLDFGSINLASTNAVTGLLGVANGGTNAGAFTAGSVVFAGTSGTYTQSNADFFWDNTKKFLAIGSTAPAGVVDISRTLDGAGLSGYAFAIGLNIRVTNTPTGTQSDRPAHGASIVLVKDGTFAVTSPYIPLRALETTVSNTGSGAINQAAGNVVQVANVGTGTIAEAISYYAYTPTCSATNLITTIYGFKVENLTVTGVTNGWGFYSAGTSDRNYLGGPLHVRPALGEPGSYSLTSWNGTGQVISLYARGMTSNGGTTPNAAEPVLVLARDSTLGVVYGSTVEFKLRRWETGGAPRSSTAMDIALTDGSGPAAGTDLISFLSNGCVGIRTAQPQAALHLPAGTATARTAPLMFTTGTSLTTAVAGAMEYTTDNLFFTISTGTARKRLLMADPVGGLTSGRMPVVTTNGRLTDSAGLIWDTGLLSPILRNDVNVSDTGITTLLQFMSDPDPAHSEVPFRLAWDGNNQRFLWDDGAGGQVNSYFNGNMSVNGSLAITLGGGVGESFDVGTSLFVTETINLGGKIVAYNNIATEGYGVPAIVDDVALTGQVANIASTNFTNAGVAGTYRVGYYMVCTTSAAGAGTIVLAVTYTQGGIVRTLTGVGVLMTSTNKATKFTNTDIDGTLIRLDSGSIAYSITVTGIYSTAAYSFFATLERLS